MPFSRRTIPPDTEDKSSYVIDQLDGEALTIPGSKAVYRILTPKIQTLENTMSVFSSQGVLADAPGFHHHMEAHDVFIVTKGAMKLWAGDKCKILGPGDFAYVPPTVIHNPQLLSPYTETMGFVAPAEWIDFFRYIGEPYEGLLIPEDDNRDLKHEIIGKVMAAKGKYDVHFHPHHQGAEVSDWTAEDEILPPTTQAYYLKANTGPRWVLGGVMSRPFATIQQTGGKFAVSSIESSSTYGSSIFDTPLSFPKTHHCFCGLEGVVEITLSDGSTELLRQGESAFVAAGTAFSLTFKTKNVRFWSFASGAGIEEVIQQAGESYKGFVIPEKAVAVDEKKVEAVLSSLGVTRSAPAANGVAGIVNQAWNAATKG